jgi:hypothetical protein
MFLLKLVSASEVSAYEEGHNVKSVSKSKSGLTLKGRYRLYF